MPTRRKSSLAVWWLLLKGSKIINVLEALLLLKLMRFTVLTIKCSCVTYFVSFNDNFRFWSACIKLDLAISNYGDLCKKKQKKSISYRQCIKLRFFLNSWLRNTNTEKILCQHKAILSSSIIKELYQPGKSAYYVPCFFLR